MSADVDAGRVLTRALRARSGALLTLSHYPASDWQESHAHDHVQVSFLLAGDMEERIGRIGHELTTPAACVKLAGTDHGNNWGRRGALILSARLPETYLDGAPRTVVDAWARIDVRPIGAIVGAAFAAHGPDEITTAIDDLIALLQQDYSEPGESPGWLRRAREAIAETDGITADEAAGIAGVHRVHLSRSFIRHYGLPLSLYRRQVMLARAVQVALRTAEPLADVALIAGFADQSHMHRAIREAFGTTPRRLRRAFERYGPGGFSPARARSGRRPT